MNAEIEDPGAEVIAAIVGEPPLALPESIDALEEAVGELEETIEVAGRKAAKAASAGSLSDRKRAKQV